MSNALTRRQALKFATMAAAASVLPARGMASASVTQPGSTAAIAPRKPLKILILGGTRFVGPALVRTALLRGHDVTLFNRGITRRWLFPGVEQRRGNRYPETGDGLKSLSTGTWDAVIDVPAYFPRIVEASAELLKDRAERYVVISSISAYSDFTQPSIDETAPVRKLEREYEERPELSEDYEWGTYGARKVLCEQAAEKRFPDRWIAVRACGIAGGGLSDPSKWYWPARLRRDSVVAAPGDGLDPVQIVDRRDIAEFVIGAIEQRATGLFNLAGPSMPFRDLLESTRRVVDGSARIVWVGDENRQRLGPINGPAPRRRVPGFANIDTTKARRLGFRSRPIEETIAADWLWFRENHRLDFDFHAANNGPAPADEAALIAELASTTK